MSLWSGDFLIKENSGSPLLEEKVLHKLGPVTVSCIKWVAGTWAYEIEYHAKGVKAFVAAVSVKVAFNKMRRKLDRDNLRGRLGAKLRRTTIIAYRGWRILYEPRMPRLDELDKLAKISQELSINAADYLVDMDKPLLGSLTHIDMAWHGPVMTADVVPTLVNTSGLYAVKNEGPGPYVVYAYQPDVTGLVELQGMVVEHTHGYRAERMVIRRLVIAKRNHVRHQDALAERYQCDVLIARQLT